MSIFLYILFVYICYKLLINMDIEKTVKFFIFALLALLPITSGLLFFDYSPINELQIVQDFGKNISLIAISLIYTGIAVIIRMLMYYILGIMKDKDIQEAINDASFLDIFYLSCAEVLIYSSIPVILTFYLKGNFIHFIGNSMIIWGIIFVLWLLWVLVFRKKQLFS